MTNWIVWKLGKGSIIWVGEDHIMVIDDSYKLLDGLVKELRIKDWYTCIKLLVKVVKM